MSASNAPQSILIVGGGPSPGKERLRQLAGAYDALVAADAGAVTLHELDLAPLLVTGDFDSVTPEQLARIPEERRLHNPDQSTTDLEKAVQWSLKTGAKRLGLTAVTGDRFDHAVNAVSLMLRYRSRAEFTLHDTHADATVAYPPGCTIKGKEGDRLSLVPAPGATGVRSSGLKYLLEGIDLVFGGRDGVSNQMLVPEASLIIKTGSLLVYRFLDSPTAKN